MFLFVLFAPDTNPSEFLGIVSLLAQENQGINAAKDLLTDITTQKLFKAIISILITYALLRGIQSLTDWISERVPRRFRLLIKQSLPFWKGLILVITLGYLLSLFLNLSQSNLFALTGTISVALGFAFKDYVSSIIAGVVTLFEAPYRVGDRVTIDGEYGEVTGYGLRGIRLQTPDDNTVTIPHNKVWTDTISNANSGQLEAQVSTHFYFDREIDIGLVMQILYQAAYSSRYTQLKLPVVVRISEKPWGIHFKLKSYPMDARDEFAYITDLTRRARQSFQSRDLPSLQMPSYLDVDRGE